MFGMELTLEQARKWRMAARIAFALVAFVAPTLIIGFRFKLFSQATTVKWSIAGITLLLIVGWRFKKRIAEWIGSWEDSNILKHILVAIGKVWPFALVVALLFVIQQSATKILVDALFCLEWACALELAAYLLIYPIEQKLDWIIRRMIRKDERKADMKEALREMKAEEAGSAGDA